MKLITLIVFCLFSCLFSPAFAANPSYQSKLIVTCRIYGFMKYYHSEVSTCKVDWDAKTKVILPLIKDDIDLDSFNSILKQWINSAGTMLKATTPEPIVAPENKTNLDFQWFNDASLRADIVEWLDSIRVNFRPHPSCWVKEQSPYSSVLIFPKDSNTFKTVNTSTPLPDSTRIMGFFKYWNIVKYFNINNEFNSVSWNTILNQFILPMCTDADATNYYFNIKKIGATLNDLNVDANTMARYLPEPLYPYAPQICLQYIEGKYRVVKSIESGVNVGFIVEQVNNKSIKQIEDSLRLFLSSNSEAMFHSRACRLLLTGPESSVVVTFRDNQNNTISKRLSRSNRTNEQFFTPTYAYESLRNTAIKHFNCNISYVNLSKYPNFTDPEIWSSKAIIFDLRDFPNIFEQTLANILLPNKTLCSRTKHPDINYPGTAYWEDNYFGSNSNTNPYQGRVYILVSERTQNLGEYDAMILKSFPGAKIMGSKTSGYTGSNSFFGDYNSIRFGFSANSGFTPNGVNIQRNGLPIDIEVNQSWNSFIQLKDDALEKVLQLEKCNLNTVEDVSSSTKLTIFPNPSNGVFTLETSANNCEYRVLNTQGKLMLNGEFSFNGNIDLSQFADGIYILESVINGNVHHQKLVLKH